MKVILKDDIESLGLKGDIVKVANGYARNYLIPKGLVEIATPSSLRRLEEEKRVYERKMQRFKGEAEKIAKKLGSITCEFTLQTGEDGKTFGSITSIDIERSLQEKGFDIKKRQILLQEPIKKIGSYTVPVNIHPEVSVEIKVEVKGEEKTKEDK